MTDQTQDQELKVCPHCTEKYGLTGREVYWTIGHRVMNKISRRDGQTICRACGLAEALADAFPALTDDMARIVVEQDRQEAMRQPSGFHWGKTGWPTGGYDEWIAQAKRLGRLTEDGWKDETLPARRWPDKGQSLYYVGQQILYVPSHAKLDDPDVQAGFIVAVYADGSFGCRYWRERTYRAGAGSILRTKANSERTPAELIHYVDTRPPQIVARTCGQLSLNYGERLYPSR